MSWLPIANLVPQYTNAGVPYSGAVLKAYRAGTSTVTPFATDSTGGTTATSIALNASGFPEVSGNVVIPHIDRAYKLALYPSQAAADADSGAVWTMDNLSLVQTVSEWTSGPTPSFVSSTSFTLSGDKTTDWHPGRRIQAVDSGGTKYGWIVASVYSDPSTTITVIMDGGGSLDSGLSAVSHGIISAENSSLPMPDPGSMLGWITGGEATYNSATQLDISACVTVDTTGTAWLRADAVTLDTSTTGLGGLDTGSVAADKTL